MESLAVIVSLMLLAQIVFGIAVLTFNIIYWAKGKFKNTSLVLLGLLTLETAWALTVLPAFGFPPLIFVVISALFRFLPSRKSKK